jgi:hypothetical protein
MYLRPRSQASDKGTSLDARRLKRKVVSSDKEALMALARVVSFEGVSTDRIEEMKREMVDQERPEGLPASELVVLHDPEREKSLAIVFFETEDDYRRGDEVLDSMPAAETPGKRTSVAKYNVAVRMKG